MRFGIVTPVLNGRDYIRACCASVAAQVEGGCPHPPDVTHYIRESSRSTETVEDIAAEYGCEYKREEDTGLYDAIARGLDAAAADGCDILAWLNADEQYLPGAFNSQFTIYNSQFVFGDYLIADPDVPSVLAARREIPAREFYLRHGVNYIMSCATFFTREAWLKYGPFDLSYKYAADKKFYFKALASGAKFRHISAWQGAYGATGRNKSLDEKVHAERARLRGEIGAFKSPAVRKTIRAMRIVEKVLRGCHRREHIVTTLYDRDGKPCEVSGVYTGKWVDK